MRVLETHSPGDCLPSTAIDLHIAISQANPPRTTRLYISNNALSGFHFFHNVWSDLHFSRGEKIIKQNAGSCNFTALEISLESLKTMRLVFGSQQAHAFSPLWASSVSLFCICLSTFVTSANASQWNLVVVWTGRAHSCTFLLSSLCWRPFWNWDSSTLPIKTLFPPFPLLD